MANKISAISLVQEFKKFEPKIKKIGLKILKILKKNNLAADVFLADNQEMRKLNKKYRGKNKPANVLSFEEPREFINPPSRMRKIGEVYIDIAQSTAHGLQLTAKNQQSVSRKLLAVSYLLAHGILHLLGYSHKGKNDRIKMEKLEQYISRNL